MKKKDIKGNHKVKVNPKNFARCDKHLIPLNFMGDCIKCVEEERCDGHMPFYSRDFESMFDQINKLKKK